MTDREENKLKAWQILQKLLSQFDEEDSRDEIINFISYIILNFYAESLGILPRIVYTHHIEPYTPDEGELRKRITIGFQIMKTPISEREVSSSNELHDLPFLGFLLPETLLIPSFSTKIVNLIYNGYLLNWTEINPMIIGSLYQGILENPVRSDLGSHFTSHQNILNVIEPLFLNKLREEFIEKKQDVDQLVNLLIKISNITILDPSCGSGNFLLVAFQMLRDLQLSIVQCIRQLSTKKFQQLQFHSLWIKLSQFYGIDIDATAVEITKLAMWIVDHQFRTIFENKFGVKNAISQELPRIICDNALRSNWTNIVSPDRLDYIIGNPPFLGNSLLSSKQKEDMKFVMADKISSYKSLDYVAGWLVKAAEIMVKSDIETALVTTSSITQGQQPAILWDYLLDLRIKIKFAFRPFKWRTELTTSAMVHVVILGLQQGECTMQPELYYQADDHEFRIEKVDNINPYIIPAEDVLIKKRRKPLSPGVSPMKYGGKPVEGGYLFFRKSEIEDLVKMYPNLAKYVRPLWGAREVISGEHRYCLWLENIPLEHLRSEKGLTEILENVAAYRKSSKKQATRDAARTPHVFAEPRQPQDNFIIVPRHTSSSRYYIPFRYLDKENIINDAVSFIDNASLYEFGILSSKMHMVWTELTAGRLGEGYRYGSTTVYNTFPFPEISENELKSAVVESANKIIEIRQKHIPDSLKVLYDPDSMPEDLLLAHQELDKAVDRCYREQPFRSDIERIRLLLTRYKKLRNG